MKKCNKCGKILPDTAKFCRNCGSSVTDPSSYTEVNEDGSEIKPNSTESSVQKVKRCKKCGNIVPMDARFCRNCGSDMNNPDNYILEGGPEEKKEETKKPVHAVKKCNKCGNIVPDTAKFCNVCGADMKDSANYTMVDEATGNPVESAQAEEKETAEKTEEIPAEKTESQKSVHKVKKCRICGNIVPADVRFCNSCGADMNDSVNYILVDDPNETTVKDTSAEKTEPVSVEPETPVEETKPVHPVKKCNQCGNIVPDTAKFCNVCGADMRDSSKYTIVDEETGNPVEESTTEAEEPEPVSDATPVKTEETETEAAGTTVEKSETTSKPDESSETAEEVPSSEEPSETPVEETTEPAHDVEESSGSSETNEDVSDSVPETSDETPEEPSVENTETDEHPDETDQTVPETSEDTAESENAETPDHTEESSGQEETPETPADTAEETAEDTEEPASDETVDVTSEETESNVSEETVENTESVTEPSDSGAESSEETTEQTEEIPSEPEKPVHQIKKCNKCGNIVSDDAKFCNVCGSDMNDPANYTLVNENSEQSSETEKEPVHKVKKCNTCGSIVPDNARFCNTCGADMQNPANYSLTEEAPVHKVKKCNKCGNIVPDEAKFCNVCGSDMNDPANYSMVEEAAAPKVKKCNKCGNIVADGAKFCNVCGADMNDPANYTMVDAPKSGIDTEQVRQAVNEAGAAASATVQSAANAVNKAVKSDKVQSFLHNKKAVTGVIIGAIALVVLIIVLAASPKTINLADYTTINVTGYNGHGTAEVTINEQKLENDIYAAAQKKGTTQYVYSTDFDPEYKLDKKDNLSNGDTVTLTWDVDPNALSTLKIRLKTNDIKKKVSDLKKADTFDAFKGIKVQVKGAAPYGEAELNKDSKDGLVYKLNKTTGLSNGDKIKVTVSSSYDDDGSFTQYVQEYGKIPEKTTKTFEVSDLDTYVTSANDLSDDVIKKMRSQAEDVIKADDASNLSDDVRLDSLTYQGLYFLKAKDRKDDDGDDYYDDAYNKVYIVELQTFTAEDYDGNTYTEKAYTAVEFNSISKASDGTINVDLSDYSELDNDFYTDDDAEVYLPGYETQDKLYEDCVTAQADKYTSETKAAS